MDRSWISVRQQLPTSDGRFEVTIKGRNGRHVEMCNFSKSGVLYKWGDGWSPVNVIAWRERDKPYTGE
jgi:ribosome modulation factor